MDSRIYHNQHFTWGLRYDKTLREYMPKGLTGRILDAGCSLGTTTMRLAEVNPCAAVVGIDKNTEIITQANRILRENSHIKNASFMVEDFYHLQDKEFNQFNRVIAANNWLMRAYDANESEQRVVIQSLATHLAHRGILIMSWDDLIVALKKDEGNACFELLEDRLTSFFHNSSGFEVILKSFKHMIYAATQPGYLDNYINKESARLSNLYTKALVAPTIK